MEESKSTAGIAGLKNVQESKSTAGIAGLKNVQESKSTADLQRFENAVNSEVPRGSQEELRNNFHQIIFK